MRLVIIESPWQGGIERNQTYLQLCIRDCIRRGESPYASHQMLTQALDDKDTRERDIGIRAGYAWWRYADRIVFYTDLGWSKGMEKARMRARTMDVKIEERSLGALHEDS